MVYQGGVQYGCCCGHFRGELGKRGCLWLYVSFKSLTDDEREKGLEGIRWRSEGENLVIETYG